MGVQALQGVAGGVEGGRQGVQGVPLPEAWTSAAQQWEGRQMRGAVVGVSVLPLGPSLVPRLVAWRLVARVGGMVPLHLEGMVPLSQVQKVVVVL